MVVDTAYALSSGRLPAGVAVIRVSGSRSRFVIETLCGSVPEPRTARFVAIRDASGDLLDRGLVLYFPAPGSFTGEDCAELQVHGGPAVVAAVLNALSTLNGLRPADPGEFSRRAFLNGKIDLTGAEALSDLIAAETDWQRRFAMQNAGGRQRQLYEIWRTRLIHARALIEAELDFSDETDVPGSVSEKIWPDIAALRHDVLRHVDGYSKAEVIRDGVRVVMIGAPNSGKSTLLNALAKRDVAIVSDEPGTTRDLVEVALDLGGAKIILTDTAGIRSGTSQVERMGIERALDSAREAHLVLLLSDMTSHDEAVIDLGGVAVLKIGSKSDLVDHGQGEYDLVLSAKEGTGIAELLTRLSNFAAQAASGAEAALPSRIRHVHHLGVCAEQLREALDGGQMALELRAEHLRQASTSLGRLTGAVDVEDLLDVIFSEFCVGK